MNIKEYGVKKTWDNKYETYAYVCFECEDIQIKKKYPNAIYNDDCEWVIYE